MKNPLSISLVFFSPANDNKFGQVIDASFWPFFLLNFSIFVRTHLKWKGVGVGVRGKQDREGERAKKKRERASGGNKGQERAREGKKGQARSSEDEWGEVRVNEGKGKQGKQEKKRVYSMGSKYFKFWNTL